MLSYITARTAQNRFDAVLGPESWKPKYTETKDGIKCGIAIRLPGSDEWIEKEDGGGYADMPAEDDTEKSGFSDAFKRAAVVWGVGRYLYRDGVPKFSGPPPATVQPLEQAIESNGFHRRSEPVSPPPAPSAPPASNGQHGNLPRNGRALFAWSKDHEQKTGFKMLNHLNEWSKIQGFPSRMIDWTDDQVKIAVDEASRKIGGSAPSADVSAQSTGDMPANFVPDGSIEKPGQGRFLYKLAKEAEEKHGCTFVQPLNAWGKATGRPDKLVDWAGRDLEDGWRYLCFKVQSLAGPVATPAPSANGDGQDLTPLKRAVFGKAKVHHHAVYGSEPTDDQARASLAKVYGELYPGETLATADGAKLANLSRAFDELIVESDIPF